MWRAMGWRWVIATCGVVALAVLVEWLGREASAGGSSAEGEARVQAKLAELAAPFDSPGAAAAFYQLKRTPIDKGGPDVTERYRLARERMATMPRYSIRRGGFVDATTTKAELETWRSLGPGNIGGRTRALLIHPTQPATMWAAGVSGGVWKTTNGGASWQPLSDLQPNIAVGSMAMVPGSPQVIYAGTGEGFFREEVRGTGLPLRGNGIFKSTNGGSSWTRLGSTANGSFHWVNDLVVSHNSVQRVYAATRTGVWRSNNGGGSWTRILASSENGGCLDLALRTDRPTDELLAACGTLGQARIYRSLQAEGAGGWSAVFAESGMGRTSLAIAPSNQNVVYALAASFVGGPGGNFNGGLHAVFRSDQGGAPGTWNVLVRSSDSDKLNTLILSNPVIANVQECGFSGSNSYSNLGWYANVTAVDPTDPDVVYAGGVDLFRSDDGGQSWGVLSHWFESPPSAHADQHAVVFHPSYNGSSNQTMFLAGDGGVWRTRNARARKGTGPQATCASSNSGVQWTSLNNGYGVTQFYHGAPYPDGRTYLGGTQDNGTLRGSDGAGINGWSRIFGGDGGYVAIDPGNPNVLYVETQFLGLRKSTDGGSNFSTATAGISESNADVLFIMPFTMDLREPRRLWTGGRRLWRTTNGAASWTQASAALPGGGRVSAVAVDPGDSSHVFAGSDVGHVVRHANALATGASTTWASSRPRSGYVTWIAIDPFDGNVVYATYAGFGGGAHVWRSTNGGVSWSGLEGSGSGRLPDIPVHALVVDPTNPQRLFLGTDLGVFVSADGGERWAVENSGFANAVTESLSLGPGPGGEPSLFAFTHGRGAWRVELSEGTPGTVQFSQEELSVSELDGEVAVTVTRTGGTAGEVSVSYATGGGTASAGSDYATTAGTLTWAAGDAAPKSFTVQILDDAFEEGPETVELTLSDAGGGAELGEPAVATLTIVDNDVAPSECVASDTVMCLGGRFKVEITWRDFVGESGPGRVVPDTPADDSGLFWFFSPANWELLVKVLDGCAINGHHWVFFGATTDVGYTLTVTDTERGVFRRYENGLGVAAPSVTETRAFETCP